MKKPKIYFHHKYFCKDFERYMENMHIDKIRTEKIIKKCITKFINEAWGNLMEVFDVDFIKRIDIVMRGGRPRISPLVTSEGVVIRLDLGMEIDYKDTENLRSIIFHEIYHLSDRLDPKFEMDYHLDAEFSQKKLGKIINIVWDLYIEFRKFYKYKIMPIYCKDMKNQDTTKIKAMSHDEFLDICDSGCDTKISESIFNEVWGRSSPITYSQICDYANQICPKEERWNNERY